VHHIRPGLKLRIFSLIVICALNSFAQVTSESDLKREGNKYFDAQDFEKALPDYSRLLSLYPNNFEYMYRFGVCQIMAGNDKTGAFSYLEKVLDDQKTPVEVWYYLGKSYLVIGEYAKAKDAFNKFKTVGGSRARKFDVDTYITNAENAEKLVKARKNVVIMNSREVPKNNFYSAYDFSNAPGKIVNASEEFYSQLDRNKQKDAVMFMTNDKQTILMSSYGMKGDNGKDIYIVRKLADGTWSKAQNLGVVNSPKDEDYPFLDRDGKTLYFSSCGHNSMGGYDIFKSVFDFNTGQWSEPENMGVPINSVYDDLLFIPRDNKNADYATDVESAINQISIRSVEIPDGLSEMLTISGEFIPRDQQLRRDARITVLTSDGTGVITSVHTDPVTGKYDLIIAPGQTYMLVVEGGGYVPHAESFELPAGLTEPVLKQVVYLDKDQQKEAMTVENYFSSGKVASEPTAVLRHSYEANADTTNMINITINDEVVRVPAPSASAESHDSQKGIADEEYNSKPSVVVNGAEADSSRVEKKDSSASQLFEENDSSNAEPPSEEADSLQMNFDATGSDESISDNSTSFSKDITNEELAKIAFADAKELQIEIDSMKQESAAMKKSADDLDSYADLLKASGADSDTTVSSQIETMHLQAGQFRSQADLLDKTIAEREQESNEALANANDILKASANSKTGSNKKRSNTNAKSHPVKSHDETATLADNSQIKSPERTELQDDSSKQLTGEQTKDSQTQERGKSDGVNAEQVNRDQQATQHDSPTSDSVSPDDKTVALNIDSALSTAVGNTEQSAKGENDLQSKTEAEKTSAGNTETVKTTDELANNSADKVAQSSRVDSEITEKGNEQHEPVTNNTNVTLSDGTIVNQNALSVQTDNKQTQSGAVNTSQLETKPDGLNAGESNSNPASEAGNFKSVQKVEPDLLADNLQSKKTNSDPAVKDPLNAKTDLATDNSSQPAATVDQPADDKTVSVNTSDVIKAEDKTTAETTVPVNNADSKQSSETSAGSKTAVPVEAESTTKADSKTSADNTEIKSEPGEIPKTVDPNNFPGYANITVKEEAKTEYRQAQVKLDESNLLSNQSLKLQQEISHMKSSPERDSKILESNEISQRSMDSWQEGLHLIEEARKLEPDIDYKMGVIDFAEKRGSGDAVQSGSDSQPLAMNTEPKSDSNKKDESTQSKETEVKPVAAEQAKITEDTVNDHLDTSHPDYPLYEKLQKDITDKQVETIDVFADGINLSRMASDERDQANTLMDEAQTEKDPDRKAHLLKSADELKTLAASHEDDAKKKFEVAKTHTTDVKSLVAQMKEVKERITIRPDQNVASTNNVPTVITSGKGKKLSEGGGVTIVEKPENKKMDAQTFAMSERANSELIASDEEISAVNITEEQKNKFMNTCFNRMEGAAYSESNPVPIDPSLPEGLVFKIQIGAFHNPLPPSTFKNLQPLSGETTRPGWIRYCVGFFRTFEPANTVKNEIKQTGYKDAFVVAYYNGKRIDLNDAYTLIRNNENVEAYRSESAKEMAVLRNMDIKPFPVNHDQDVLAFYAKQPIRETLRDNDEETIRALSEVDNGTTTTEPLKYTVQLGIYNSATTPAALASMSPLPPSKIKSNSFRYTTMTFDDKQSADSIRAVAIRSGIKDAFVVGVKNGKYVSVNNASVTADNRQKWNDIVKEDTPTSEPVYKVQIGAFRNDVPYNIVESYLTISDKGITRKTDERGLHIFYVGSFSNIGEAAALKSEVVSKGIKDAFVVVLKDGKRIAIPQ
jgi:hypothetical protein